MKQYLLFIAILSIGTCLNNGLGLTPPMGWNSWNHYACSFNETVVK